MSGGPDTSVKTTDQTQQGRSLSVGDSTSSGSTAGGGTTSQVGGQYGSTAVDVPDWLKSFVGQSTGVAGTALGTASGLAGGYQLPPEAMQALTATAGGDYLYGGPQQQAFIDAAVRGASPGIFSQFGAAGGGGGGLQRAALDQSAVDAYAKLYQGERANQLSAAEALPGISQIPFNMQTQLAQLAGGLPGQFAPFLGQTNAGGTFGFGDTSNFGTTQQTGSTRQESKTSGSGTTTETTPIYNDPWWKTALTLGLGATGLASGIFPASAAGKAAGGFSGGLFGGLLGSK